MHYAPGVTTAAGTEAYLLAAGAAVDVASIRSWDLPPQTLNNAVRDYRESGSKRRSRTRSAPKRSGSPRDGQNS
jgi:hypothetical protein